MLSERIRKCKQFNRKEQQILQQRIELLAVKEASVVHDMDRQRLMLMQDLHLSR